MELRINGSIKDKLSFRLSDVCFFLLCFFLFDGVFHFTRFFFVGENILRVGLLLVLLAASIPFLLTNVRWFGNAYNLIIVNLICVLTISYIRAILLHQNMEIANEYVKGFIYLAYIPVLFASVRTTKRLDQLLEVVVLMGSMLSIYAIIMFVANIINTEIYDNMRILAYNMGFGTVIQSVGLTARIMLNGIVYQSTAIFICTYMFMTNKMSHRISMFFLFVNIIGVLLSYARGVIGGVICGALMLLVMLRHVEQKYRRTLRNIIFIVGIFCICVIVVSQMAGAKDLYMFLLNRLLGATADTVASDMFRKDMNKQINDLIMRTPLFGGGLGNHIDLRDGRIEMVYHDLVLRIGFVGLLIFLLPYIRMLFAPKTVERFGSSECRIAGICLLSALSAVVIMSYTNPYFIGSMGLFIYCLCIRLYSVRYIPIENLSNIRKKHLKILK